MLKGEDKGQVVVIKLYQTTDNGTCNTSEFMKDLLKKQKKISFSGTVGSHQNGASDKIFKIVFNIEITMLMHYALICPKDTLSTDFGQRKCTMLYGSKFGSLICSMVSKLIGKFEPCMFWIQGCRSLE